MDSEKNVQNAQFATVKDVRSYIEKETCYNCGGHNLTYLSKKPETNNNSVLIVCEECGKALECDFLDGIKM